MNRTEEVNKLAQQIIKDHLLPDLYRFPSDIDLYDIELPPIKSLDFMNFTIDKEFVAGLLTTGELFIIRADHLYETMEFYRTDEDNEYELYFDALEKLTTTGADIKKLYKEGVDSIVQNLEKEERLRTFHKLQKEFEK